MACPSMCMSCVRCECRKASCLCWWAKVEQPIDQSTVVSAIRLQAPISRLVVSTVVSTMVNTMVSLAELHILGRTIAAGYVYYSCREQQ